MFQNIRSIRDSINMNKFFPLSSKRIVIVIAVWCCLYLFWLVNTENLSTIFGPLLSENCGNAMWGCDFYWRTGEYLFKEEIVEMLTQLLSPIFVFVALNFLANHFFSSK